MLYSISQTTTIPIEPYVKSIIRLGGRVGVPFCVTSDNPITKFTLIKEGDKNGYPIDIGFISSSSDMYYYNANVDLIEYLEDLGYIISNGRYRLAVNDGSNITRYTDLFYLDCSAKEPDSLGAYSEAYSEGYAT